MRPRGVFDMARRLAALPARIWCIVRHKSLWKPVRTLTHVHGAVWVCQRCRVCNKEHLRPRAWPTFALLVGLALLIGCTHTSAPLAFGPERLRFDASYQPGVLFDARAWRYERIDGCDRYENTTGAVQAIGLVAADEVFKKYFRPGAELLICVEPPRQYARAP